MPRFLPHQGRRGDRAQGHGRAQVRRLHRPALGAPSRPLREVRPGLLTFLVENVVMNNDDREHFDTTLRCHSFVCEASDLGPVRRKRFWWTNTERELREVPGTKWGAWDPPAEAPARDCSQIMIPRLFAQGKVLLPAGATKGTWRLHPAVMQGKATLPTLIIPAPTGEGRSAPPGARPKGDPPRIAGVRTAADSPLGTTPTGRSCTPRTSASAQTPGRSRRRQFAKYRTTSPPGTRPQRAPIAAPGRP